MYINTLYFTLKFDNIHLLVWMMQEYDQNKEVKISASNNYKSTTLSIPCLYEYSTGH